MPVKPIDILSMPPKSQETSMFQKNHLDHVANGEQRTGEQFMSQVKQDMQRPVQMKQKKENNSQFDAKEKGQNEYERLQKKTAKKQEKKTIFPSISGSSFDITI